jgi:hypothetical protein
MKPRFQKVLDPHPFLGRGRSLTEPLPHVERLLTVLATVLMNIFDFFAFGYLPESEILIQRTLMTAAFWVEE